MGSICHSAVVDAGAGDVAVASVGATNVDVSIATVVVIVGMVQADCRTAEAVLSGNRRRRSRLAES